MNQSDRYRQQIADCDPEGRIAAVREWAKKQDRNALPTLCLMAERDDDSDVLRKVAAGLVILGQFDRSRAQEGLELIVSRAKGLGWSEVAEFGNSCLEQFNLVGAVMLGQEDASH